MDIKILSVVVILSIIFASGSVGTLNLKNKDFCDSKNFVLKHRTTFKVTNYPSRSYNQDASVLIGFKDHLYMGTLNLRDGCELWRTTDGSNWTEIVGRNGKIPNGFGTRSNIAIWIAKVFGEYLYLGTVNAIQGCEVWRSSDGLNWTAVIGGNSHIPNGFGRFSHRFNSYAWYMEVFNISTKENPIQQVVPHLCIGTLNVLFGGQIWASPDGENWTRLIGGINKKITGNGFGDRDNYGIRTMKLYNGRLYVGTATRFYRISKGCEIWITNDGFNWTRVNEDGFGDSWNIYAWSIEEFNGSLYVGTLNLKEGCELWRTSDGINWTRVVDRGINDRNNLGVRKMTVFQDQLYASTFNLISGCEVWRTKDGLNWTQVNEDGFGNPRNIAIRAFAEFNDNLYAGTYNLVDGYNLWQYNGNYWSGPLFVTIPKPRVIQYTMLLWFLEQFPVLQRLFQRLTETYEVELDGDQVTGTVSPISEAVCIDKGYTPGYWKKNPKDQDGDGCPEWPGGYHCSDYVYEVFSLPVCLDDLNFDGNPDTLMDALKFHGGFGYLGKARNLLRHAVAALLNSAHPCIDYAIGCPLEVIDLVHDTLMTYDIGELISVKNMLDEFNNAGCPCNAHGDCEDYP